MTAEQRNDHYHLTFADGRREPVHLRAKALNRGADGAIYRSPDGRFAFKFYHEPGKDPERRTKVWEMILHPPEDSQANHFAWPCALINDSAGRFVGFAMPLLDIASYASLDPLLSGRGRQRESLPNDNSFRLKVAINLAKRVAELHAKGHCIIDLKPANLLVHRHTGDIAVVDCDGFAVRGNTQFFPAHQFTLGFIAPEAFRASQSPQVLRQAQDQFALAVILFKLLNNGLHPFQGVPAKGRELPSDNQNRIAGGFYPYGLRAHADIGPSPWSVHRNFPTPLRNAFDQSFNSAKRPSADYWVELLQQALQHQVRCQRNPDHAHWGKQCPYCALENQRVVVPPAQSTPRPRRAARTQNPQAAIPLNTVFTGHQQTHIQVQWHINPVPSSQPYVTAQILRWRKRIQWLQRAGAALLALLALYWLVQLFYDPGPALPEAVAKVSVLKPSYRTDDRVRYADQRHAYPGPYANNQPVLIPHHRLGRFDTPERLPVLLSRPASSDYANNSRFGFRLDQLNTRTKRRNTNLDTTTTRPVNLANLSLGDWQADHNGAGIFSYGCNPQLLCHEVLYHNGRSSPISFSFPTQSARSRATPQKLLPWRFNLSPDGNFMAMASGQQVVLYKTDQPDRPLASLDLRQSLHNYRVDALSLTHGGSRIFVSLSQSFSGRTLYDAELIELEHTSNGLVLVSMFQHRAIHEGIEMPAAFHSVDAAGNTLALADYRLYHHEGSPISGRYNREILGYPGISIWRRDQQGHWQYSHRIDGMDRLTREPVQITRPLPATAYSTQSIMAHGPLGNHGQPHLTMQLSPDGKHLLTGLQLEHHNNSVYANAYLFNVQAEEPKLLARLREKIDTPRSDMHITYGDIRLSNNANHIALGLFSYHEKRNGPLTQAYKLRIYDLQELTSKGAL